MTTPTTTAGQDDDDQATPTFTLADIRFAMDAAALEWAIAELRGAREYDRRMLEEPTDLPSWKQLPRGLSRRDKARFLAGHPDQRYRFQPKVDQFEPATDEELVSVLRPVAQVPDEDWVAPPAPGRWEGEAAPRPPATFRRDDPGNPFRSGLENRPTIPPPTPTSARTPRP